MAMAEVTQLHIAYRRQMGLLRTRAVASARLVGTSSLDLWLPAVVDLTLDAQRSAVALTDAYMSTEASLVAGSTIEPWALDADRLIGSHARRGTFLEDVYGRQFFPSIGSRAFRLTREINTDITLAQRAASFVHTDGDPRIVGYRRVLGSGPNCALCVVAATRTYKSESLQPIHSHCGCTQQVVYRDGPAPKVDKAFLNDLYAKAGANTYADLRRIRVNDSEIPEAIRPKSLPSEVLVIDDAEIGPALVPVA